MSDLTPILSERELFAQLLFNQPLYAGDAVVVLCGEDVEPRIQVAQGVMRGGGAQFLVLSGGRSEPPAVLSGEDAFPLTMGAGIAFDRLIVEQTSQHTREQAEHVIAMAQSRNWKRLLLVASGYHQVRAFLTFLKVLEERELDTTIRLVSVPAGHTHWGAAPEGMPDGATRFNLLARETQNVTTYQQKGDVASYEDGIRYLLDWEQRP